MSRSVLALIPVALVAVLTMGMAVHTGAPASGVSLTTIQLHTAVIVQTSSTSSTGVNGTCIWTTLWNDASGFLNTILKGFENLINGIFGGIGTSIQEVFQGWGYAVVQQTGIFAPVVIVAILALTFFVMQMFLPLYAGEKDVEEEVEAA